MTTPSGVERGVAVADEELDAGHTVGQFLGEGQGFSHRMRGALAQGMVEALDARSKTTAFIAGNMLARRDDQSESLPRIREEGGVFPVAGGQSIPHAMGLGFTANITYLEGDDLVGGHMAVSDGIRTLTLGAKHLVHR